MAQMDKLHEQSLKVLQVALHAIFLGVLIGIYQTFQVLWTEKGTDFTLATISFIPLVGVLIYTRPVEPNIKSSKVVKIHIALLLSAITFAIYSGVRLILNTMTFN